MNHRKFLSFNLTGVRTDSVHIIVPPADSIRTGHVKDAA